MDFSQLSDEDLIALKSKDYSKLSDEALLALKGGSAPTQEQPKPGIMDQAMQMSQRAMQGTPMDLLGRVAPQLAQQGADFVGEKGAEALAEKGMDPRLAAGAGTMAQMTPDILMSLMPGEAALSKAPQIETGLRQAGRMIKGAGERVLEGPATKQMGLLKNTVSDLPVEKLNKESMLEGLRKQAGGMIEKVREAAGVPQKLHDVSSVDVNSFANMMKTLEPKTKNLKTLLGLRDRADAVLRSGVDDTQRAFIRQGMSKLDNAIAQSSKTGEKIAAAYKQYGETQMALDEVPGDVLKKRIATQKGIRELSPKANREKTLRKWGALGLGLGGGLGLFK